MRFSFSFYFIVLLVRYWCYRGRLKTSFLSRSEVAACYAPPPPSVSSKSMALPYLSTWSQSCFFGISQALRGDFQPDFVFSCCLIKDTEKLFSPPAAWFWGSKLKSAMMSRQSRIWSRNRSGGSNKLLHCHLREKTTWGRMHVWKCRALEL